MPGCFGADSTITVLSSVVFGEQASGLERSDEHLEHLLGGDDHQAEGQMGGHLDRTAYAHVPSAVFVVQMGVDPFDRRALVVTPHLRRREPDLFAPARIVVNEGHMGQAHGHLSNLLGVVGGVGQVVEADDAFGRHLGQGDGRLAVV